MKAHCFCWVSKCGYLCCCKCGLLWLRNLVSRKASRTSCPGRED